MFYYEVLASSAKYHGKTPLTYQNATRIGRGVVVRVPIKQQLVLALIYRRVTKPDFATKTVEHIFDIPALPPQIITLIDWMLGYYQSPLGVIVQHFLPKLLSDKLGLYIGDTVPSTINTTLPSLTAEQKSVLKRIAHSGTYLLHGETGSGKTRVYIELAKRAIAANKSIIVLTPEISLTSQLAGEFQSTFPGQVVIVHSRLTGVERRRLWLRMLHANGPLIVLGPRSALFSPLRDIGLIVIDEAHETAYKQEQSPYYHAIRVAGKLAGLHKSLLVLGSATPPVTEYYTAEQKEVPILRMQQLAHRSTTSTATIVTVDLKDRSQFTRKPHLSDTLIETLSSAMERHEQSLLFLNQRGTARIVLCEVCGWQALCPRCDVSLIYHGDNHTVRCHTCGFSQPALSSCPVCHNPDIVLKGIGTKAIADEVISLFPKARVQRFDTDNIKSERFEEHYHKVKAGEIDILVGTQTLAKGLDLPNLSVVGVICADTSLYLPDYTAQERTYQLLSQVVGRVGRGHRNGYAVVQTYMPDNPVLRAALSKDWDQFYQTELTEREIFLFPPFCFLLKLTCRRASSKSAQRACEDLIASLRQKPLKVQIIGPTPSFHAKVSNKFQWQIVVKAKQRGELIKVIEYLPSNWTFDIDPVDLL